MKDQQPAPGEDLVPLFVNPVCCNGCGSCYELFPEVFAPEQDGRARLLVAEAPAEIVRQAIAYCPHDCIE